VLSAVLCVALSTQHRIVRHVYPWRSIFWRRILSGLRFMRFKKIGRITCVVRPTSGGDFSAGIYRRRALLSENGDQCVTLNGFY
jgi:hypothetical protein